MKGRRSTCRNPETRCGGLSRGEVRRRGRGAHTSRRRTFTSLRAAASDSRSSSIRPDRPDRPAVSLVDEAGHKRMTASPTGAAPDGAAHAECTVDAGQLLGGTYFPVVAIVANDGKVRDRWRVDRAVVVEGAFDPRLVPHSAPYDLLPIGMSTDLLPLCLYPRSRERNVIARQRKPVGSGHISKRLPSGGCSMSATTRLRRLGSRCTCFHRRLPVSLCRSQRPSLPGRNRLPKSLVWSSRRSPPRRPGSRLRLPRPPRMDCGRSCHARISPATSFGWLSEQGNRR